MQISSSSSSKRAYLLRWRWRPRAKLTAFGGKTMHCLIFLADRRPIDAPQTQSKHPSAAWNAQFGRLYPKELYNVHKHILFGFCALSLFGWRAIRRLLLPLAVQCRFVRSFVCSALTFGLDSERLLLHNRSQDGREARELAGYDRSVGWSHGTQTQTIARA